jgi:hypothetical protein
MELMIVIAVIVGIFVLVKSGSEPNVENLTVDQMVRHTKALQDRIARLNAIPNKSDSVRAEIAKREAQWKYAMSVWRRKNEEESGS